MGTKRNTTLELLKLIAAYMVVFIHVSFQGNFGIVIDLLARFAVPIFFLISGFFSYKIPAEKIKKRIKHIALLILFSTLLYTVFNLLILILDAETGGIPSYFGQYIDIKTLLKLLIFNVPVSSLHLWYLFAALYVYVVFYFVSVKQIKEKTVLSIAFSLLILHLLLTELLSAFGIVIPTLVVRNFALMGLPFFGLGLLARKYEDNLRSVPSKILVITIIAGLAESVVSYRFSGKKELYIGSLLILFSAVVLFVKYANVSYPRFVCDLTACSSYIYILHIMVARCIKRIYPLLGIDFNSFELLVNLDPLIVCIVTTALSYLIVRIGKIRGKRKA